MKIPIFIFLCFCIYPLWIKAQGLDIQNKPPSLVEETIQNIIEQETQAQEESESQETFTSSGSGMDAYTTLLKELGIEEIEIIEDLEEPLNTPTAPISNIKTEEPIYSNDFHGKIDHFLSDIFTSIQTGEKTYRQQARWGSAEWIVTGIIILGNKRVMNKLNEIIHPRPSYIKEFETTIKQSEGKDRAERLSELGDKRRNLTSQIQFEDMNTKTTVVKISKRNVHRLFHYLRWSNQIGCAFLVINTFTRFYILYFLNRDPGLSPVLEVIYNTPILFSDSEKIDPDQLENNSNFPE